MLVLVFNGQVYPLQQEGIDLLSALSVCAVISRDCFAPISLGQQLTIAHDHVPFVPLTGVLHPYQYTPCFMAADCHCVTRDQLPDIGHLLSWRDQQSAQFLFLVRCPTRNCGACVHKCPFIHQVLLMEAIIMDVYEPAEIDRFVTIGEACRFVAMPLLSVFEESEIRDASSDDVKSLSKHLDMYENIKESFSITAGLSSLNYSDALAHLVDGATPLKDGCSTVLKEKEGTEQLLITLFFYVRVCLSNPLVSPIKHTQLLSDCAFDFVWPANVQYSPHVVGRVSLLSVDCQEFHEIEEVQATQGLEYQEQAHVCVRSITKRDHPCFGQSGLFSKVPISIGQCIGEYVGYVTEPDVPAPEKLHCSPYSYKMSFKFDEIEVDIDAKCVGNVRSYCLFVCALRSFSKSLASFLLSLASEFLCLCLSVSNRLQEMRYLNHYDGAGAANVNFQPCIIQGVCRTLVVAMSDIKAGVELLADYGDTYFT